jgi:hypothetical protein
MIKPELHDPNRPLADRKANDRALMLPLIGCLLLTPPLAGLFQLDLRIMGIPFTGLYLFAVWGALIAGAAALAPRLQHGAGWDSEETEDDGDNIDATDKDG